MTAYCTKYGDGHGEDEAPGQLQAALGPASRVICCGHTDIGEGRLSYGCSIELPSGVVLSADVTTDPGEGQ